MQAERRKATLTPFLAALAAALAADQASKAVVRALLPQGEKQVRLLGDLLVLRQQRNPGISFGLLEGGSRALLVLLAAVPVALLCLYAWRSRESSRVVLIGAGLICGGALGNIIDRLVFGKVIDFIDPSFWPSFNLADAAVVLGVIAFAVGILFSRRGGADSGKGKRP